MSTRLQVVVADAELEGYRRTARAAGLTVSEWARQALRAAERESSSGDVQAKLAVIRRAVDLESTGREVDVREMLTEVEAGRQADAAIGSVGADVAAGSVGAEGT